MKSLINLSFLSSIVIFISSCSPTLYGPHDTSGGYSGYSTSPNEYFVQFSANGFTNSGIAFLYALYRCSELTILNGAKYFKVVDANESTFKSYVGGFNSFGSFRATEIQKPLVQLKIRLLNEDNGNEDIYDAAQFINYNSSKIIPSKKLEEERGSNWILNLEETKNKSSTNNSKNSEYNLFDEVGLSFNYPSIMTREDKKSEQGMLTSKLKGENLSIIYFKSPPISIDLFVESIVDGLGKNNCMVKPYTLTINGVELKGQIINYKTKDKNSKTIDICSFKLNIQGPHSHFLTFWIYKDYSGNTLNPELYDKSIKIIDKTIEY